MGRNKFSQSEIFEIAKLLKMKETANRFKQKAIRHDLRTKYEFQISDFNEPGKNFGLQELYAAMERHAIVILDDATIADMKAKRERDRLADAAAQQADDEVNGEELQTTDWKQAMKEWEEWEKSQTNS